MVILKWINSILLGNRQEVTQAGTGYSSDEARKKEKSQKSVDLINATLVEKAEKLGDLIASGTPWIRRKKLKSKVKEKVSKAIADEYNDPEIIEEITERITDAAEIDPFYKHLFSGD